MARFTRSATTARLHRACSRRKMRLREVIYCRPADNIDTIMSVMTDNRARHLPVMRDEKLLGMISIGAVVKFRIDEIETGAATLRQYIATA